ncbi:glycosyl hydrolase 5 family protein-like [Malania oleifera]|uniref:glycosyl hydrolase 5 family protein-like n=1 Tax=Malania oleifera TaxID=397392 RepID=UPI0025ADDA94|nr:glycosyl hydrolase 5 family protein-like [Malania oleifera]
MGRLPLFYLSFFSVVLVVVLWNGSVRGVPLYTKSRWIVDEEGKRVKLACVNWPAHLEAVVAEGLSKQPVDTISRRIVTMGFNCVRLTWPLFLVTSDSLTNVTVRQSLMSLGLIESIAGFQVHNPSIVDLSLINAFQAVVSSLASINVMVILDNHLSKPGWCCSSNDGNGFFGDTFFNPDDWLTGLTRMAALFNDTPYVVGMSLRNELRGPKQNPNAWYRYMQRGAETVHAANPNALVILSGLSYDTDLSFIQRRAVTLTFAGKHLFEFHWYSFSFGNDFGKGNVNQACGKAVQTVMSRGGFVLEKGWPLLVSEFGADLTGRTARDNRYLACFFGLAAELDFDWAWWTLAGSYYLRQGVIGLDETYGLLDWNWCAARNESFSFERIYNIQCPFRGPGISEASPHLIIFHASTSLCVLRNSTIGPLVLGPCDQAEAWRYTPQRLLTIEGTNLCLQAADGVGQAAKLGEDCANSSSSSSKWNLISDSRMHLSSNLPRGGAAVCLDVDFAGSGGDGPAIVTTNTCKCLSGNNNACDPTSQWFKLVNTTGSTPC